MTNVKWEEIILVAPRKAIFDNEKLAFHGTSTPEQTEKIVNNISEHYGIMRRGNDQDSTHKDENAEINTDFKQPIPYGIITRDGKEIYVYERLAGGGEGRLHNKLSIGVGGHMNPIKGITTFEGLLTENLMRELEEELDIQTPEEIVAEPVCLINDDFEEVSRVHIGILAKIDLPAVAEVSVRETEQLRGFWATVEELKQPEVFERLEGWSQIAVNTL